MARKIKLTEKETPIMNLLWERGPMFVREVVAAYPEQIGRASCRERVWLKV